MSSDSQLVTLKAELKAWEAAFRAEHAREPTKVDIKAVPLISNKYKLYAKSKAGPVPTAPSRSTSSSRVSSHSHSTSSSSAAPVSNTSTLPADSSIFKTPTKPKRRPASNPPTALASPTKSPSKPTYVIANSPSKLRALAAAHSTSSPNHRSKNGNAVGVVIGSPRKDNPFRVGGGSDETAGASPKKAGRNLFGGEEVGRGTEGKGSMGWESVFSGPRRGSSASVEGRSRGTSVMELDDGGDESLGPSPVKPSANGKARAFKPLLPPPPSISALKVVPPKLFESASASFSVTLATDSDSKPSSSKLKPSHHPSLLPLRGTKRPSALALPFDSEQLVEGPTEDEGTKKKGKKVVKPRVRKAKRARLLGAGEEEEDVEMDEVGRETQASVRRRNEKGVLVLELDEEGEEGEEGRTDRVVIHPRRPYFKSRTTDVDEDGEEDDEGGGGSQGSLFYRDTADLLSSQDPRLSAPSYDSDDESSHRPSHLIDIDPTIPSDLVSMLSLRSSPIKKTSLLREKDRDLRVKKLLQEPSVCGKKKMGLEDLVDEKGSEGEEEQGGSDDDWASDAEGWKDFGDGAMDGYDDSS